jgi:hypothetical protein
MINILDQETVFKTIDKFEPHLQPIFGQMSPQHILEHLIPSLHLSTGKRKIEFKGNDEMASKVKAALIHSDAEMPMGVKNPLLKDVPEDLVYTTIDEAKQALKNELNHFYIYKSNHPDASSIHPRMNVLTIDEWAKLHSKHFSHHFKQVSLI